MRSFVLAMGLLSGLAALPAVAAPATLSVVFTQDGEPLAEPAQGRFYVYEEGKRERYLAWGSAVRAVRVEEGLYDVVIRYSHDTIVEERVLESYELTGDVILEEDFLVSPANLTIEITAGGVPIHVHSGSYDVHIAGKRGEPLASRRPGERVTLRPGRYDIEVVYRDPRGLQSTWLNDYLVIDEHFESVNIGVAAANLRVSLTHRGVPVSSAEGEWDVHRPGDPQPLTGGQAGESAELPAGIYDIRASFRSFGGTPLVQWVRGVRVEGNVRKTIEILEKATAEIRVNVRRAGELLADAWFSVYPSGDTRTPLTTRRSGRVVDLPAGRYDIHCTYRKGAIRAEKWLRDREVDGLAQFDVELSVTPASLTIEPPRRVRGRSDRSKVLIMVDSSLEMAEAMNGRSRLEWVRQAVADTIDLLDDDRVAVGLRVWGIAPRNQNNCQDSTSLMPVGALDGRGIEDALDLIRPSGFAAIGDSLRKAAGDLAADGRGTVVLITGGVDTCSGDPCDAAARLVKSGRAERIHVIGLDLLQQAEPELECIGKYHAANNGTLLRKKLRAIFRQATGPDGGRVSVFQAGRNQWVAGADLGQPVHLLEGRYDVQIRVGSSVFYWNDFEVRGDVVKTAARQP